MTTIRIRVVAHWFNSWFLTTFSHPYVVVDGERRRVAWGEPTPIVTKGTSLSLGAGVRYFGRGPLLGCEPEVVDLFRAGDAGTPVGAGDATVVLRNGFLNHTPFRIVRTSPASPGRRG